MTAEMPRLATFALSLALGALSACGTATSERAEELTEPGPHDASVDSALLFDGVDDYASVGTARLPQIERDQTLMLWFRSDGAASGDESEPEVLFTLRRSDWSGLALALDHGAPLAYNVFGSRELARSETALAPGDWHHLAYVLKAGASTLYVDGASVATGPGPATNRTPIQAFIGSLDGYANLFHGAIDELRVYDRSFSAEEITAVAAGVRPDDAEPLVIYLPFNEAEGARSFDRSGLGNHAELGDGVAMQMPARVPSGAP